MNYPTAQIRNPILNKPQKVIQKLDALFKFYQQKKTNY